jgi:hypothetical protein
MKEIVWSRLLDEEDQNFLRVALKWLFFSAFYTWSQFDTITPYPLEERRNRDLDAIGFPLFTDKYTKIELETFMETIQWMVDKSVVRDDVWNAYINTNKLSDHDIISFSSARTMPAQRHLSNT